MMLNINKPTGIVLLIVVATHFVIASTPALKVLHLSNGVDVSLLKDLDCDNITNGGAIAGNESGCPNPIYDPGLIYNVLLPSGGTGTIEYVWMYTTENPNFGNAIWTALPNSNAPEYNPEPITLTTYYMRCSRRSGCTLYTGETVFVKKAVECCPGNVTDGGIIGVNQNSCSIPYNPELLNNITLPSGSIGTIEFQWLLSTVGGAFNNGTWAVISGATESSYDPLSITKTTYYARRAKVKFCNEYEYSNVVKVTLTNGVKIQLTKTDPTCFEENNGSATVNILEGTPTFMINWSNKLTMVKTIINLGGGMYMVTVTDANGCSAKGLITLDEPSEIEIKASTNPETCSTLGKINLSVSGGTQPYSYLWNTGDSTANLTDKAAGSYSVTVTDTKGCSISKVFSVLDETNLIIKAVIQINKCFGGSEGSISITVTGGINPYTYKWSNDPNNTGSGIAGLVAGIYTVTVTDDVACSKVQSFTVLESTQILSTAIITDNKCFGGSEASIITGSSGGQAPYTYKWNYNNIQTPNLFNIPAGNYSLTVTDVFGCSNQNIFTVIQGKEINISALISKPICYNDTTGSIDITVTGGISPYQYNWNILSNNQDIFDKKAGLYTVKIIDSIGCKKEQTFIIENPEDIDIAAAIINPYCAQNNGSIATNTTGGNPVYTYIWSTGDTTKDLSNVSAGIYKLTVTDSKGCTKVSNFSVSDDNGLLILETITNAKCYGDKNASISFSFTGGQAPYSIVWSNGIVNTQTINNLVAGNYSVTVTDANQCKGIKLFTVTEPDPLSINESLVTPLCNGNLTGSILTSVTGGTLPYKYEWSNGSKQTNITNIGAGTYVLTVTDANGCFIYKTILLTEPDKLLLTAVLTDPACNQSSNGNIDLTVTGGTLPYLYVWNNIPSTQDLNNLPAGTYTIKLIDHNDCSIEASYELTEPNELVIESNISNASCGLNNGKIELIISGGSGVYTYLWSNSSANKVLNQLYPGKYSVTVTDDKGCFKTADFSLIDKGDIQITANTKDNKCGDDLSGSIEIAISNGVEPYSINWSNNSKDTTKIYGLATGSYTVTVTDNNQCSAIKSFNVLSPPAIEITGTVTNESCQGMNMGAVNLSVSGGTPTYSYLWSNGVNTQNIAGLTAGVIIVTVTDQNKCSKSASFNITEPGTIVLNQNITQLICNVASNGIISLNPTGGTAPFTYEWNNGESTAELDNLTAGIYIVTVTDANQCTIIQDFTIIDPPALIITQSQINPSCNGGLNGSISITINGGIAPYKILWSNGNKTTDLVNIAAGNYMVTITDNNGCSKVETYSLSEGGNLQITEILTNITCKGLKNGAITVTLVGGTAPIIYKWSNNLSSGNTVSNLSAGIYGVSITNQSGCKSVKQFTITEPDQLKINIIKQDITCNSTLNGKLTAVPSGGTPGYFFKWSNNADTSTIENLLAGTYTVTVSDINNCKAQASTSITNPSDLALTAKASKTSCSNSADATIDLSVSGGTAPYQYIWSNNATTQDLSGLASGNYDVTVTDAHGCTKSASFAVASPLPVNFDVIVTNESCLNQKDGKAFVTNITGGSPAYSFKWNDPKNSNTQSIFNLSPGFYQVTVKDIKGCSASKSIEVKSSQLKCTSNLGDYVWIDTNKNGIQDSLESGINGIVVHLINLGADGILDTGDDVLTNATTTKTDNGKKGYYLFKDVVKGSYVIRYYIDIDKYTFTFKDKGTNDAKDSDVNPATAVTDIINVNPGDPDNLTYDAGIYQYCDNITHGGLVCCDELLCTPGQTPTLIANVTYPSGGTGPITYLWLYSTTDPNFSPGNPGWIMIPNSNTPSYQPGPLYETTYFVRCSKRGDCSNFAGESNIITKKVVEGKTAQINAAPLTICKNESVNFTSVNYGAGVSYLWDLGDGGIPGVATTNDVLTKWAFPGYKTITLYVSYGGCISADVAVVVVSGCTAKVEVIDFTAILNAEHQVDLKWKVDNIKNHLFEIERSQDNAVFSAITAIDGYPDDSGEYKVKDLKPAIGENYYRIKIFDSEANYKYTNVRDVLLEDFENQNLVVYPNPATRTITIEPLKPTEKEGIIEVSDANGSLIYQKELEAEFKQFDIDISKYIPGPYFVRIKIDGKRDLIYRIFKIE